MKTKYLTTSFISTLLLASSSVVLAEPNYPEDFTPEIVYQDKDYIAEHGGSAPSASPSSSTSSSSSGSSSSSNSEIPGDFTPEIVYQDKDYIANTKNTSSSPVKKSSISSSSSSASSSTTSDTEASSGESGMSQYLIGLGVLLAAGAFLYSRRPASEGSQSSAPAPARNIAPGAGGGTGVANYLKQNDIAEATGVAKYLDQQTLANATGVEKFLRDRG